MAIDTVLSENIRCSTSFMFDPIILLIYLVLLGMCAANCHCHIFGHAEKDPCLFGSCEDQPPQSIQLNWPLPVAALSDCARTATMSTLQTRLSGWPGGIAGPQTLQVVWTYLTPPPHKKVTKKPRPYHQKMKVSPNSRHDPLEEIKFEHAHVECWGEASG